MLQGLRNQLRDFGRLPLGTPLNVVPEPILFPGQRGDFPVRVFQRDVCLLEFLSQSRDFVAKGLFQGVRLFHVR